MIVTSKKFFMEEPLVRKMNLMVDRLNGTDDAIVLISGDEGIGKTNLASGLCFYVAEQTKRSYTPDNIFFNLDRLIDYATKTKGKVIHWDEGALGGLASEWWNKNQQKFMKLLMVARKKKHFIVICIPKFWKLNEYIVVDRSIALIHCYARKNIEKGRFVYFGKKSKEFLYEDWRRRHKRSYAKYKTFGGSFLEYMPKVFTPEEVQQYEDKKDKAIMEIGESGDDKLSVKDKRYIELKYKISQWLSQEDCPISISAFANSIGYSQQTISSWKNLINRYSFLRDF